MKKLQFSVSVREEFHGYWVLGQHFPPGVYEVDVDDKQEEELRTAPFVSVHGARPESAKVEVKAPSVPVKVIQEFEQPEAFQQPADEPIEVIPPKKKK